jgi:stage II sporulation protein Q
MKKKEKSLVIPTVYILVLFIVTSFVYFTSKSLYKYENIGLDNITYVSSAVFNRSIPIVSIPDTIKLPIVDSDVEIARFFYDANSELSKKEKSIVYYEGTYMPNTGIDYQKEEVFDVMTIYDGTVIDVSFDELLGKTVKIKHNGELISVYQGIDNIDVKVGDIVFTGQKIATSGNSKINYDLGNSMHFEIYKNGECLNPESVINQKIGDI